MAASSSLCQGRANDVRSFQDIHHVLREAVRIGDFGINIRKLDIGNTILAFSDASWPNAQDLSSQAGYIGSLADLGVLSAAGVRSVPVEWRSHRKRKCRSAFTAETIAMGAATDAALHARVLLVEIR